MAVLELGTMVTQEHKTTAHGESDTDLALLRRYFKLGDRDAMNEFYVRHADAMYRVACFRTPPTRKKFCSRRDMARSASSFPPVWHVAQ